MTINRLRRRRSDQESKVALSFAAALEREMIKTINSIFHIEVAPANFIIEQFSPIRQLFDKLEKITSRRLFTELKTKPHYKKKDE